MPERNPEMSEKNPKIHIAESPLTVTDVLTNFAEKLDQSGALLAGQMTEIGAAAKVSAKKTNEAPTSPAPSAERSIVSDVASTLNPLAGKSGGSFFKNLLVSPILRGIFRLFGGEDETESVLLEKFQFPEAVQTDVAAAADVGGVSTLRRNSFGQSTPGNPAPPSIQISIQALDARSILDRGDDIAEALKQAMLSNHDINNQVNEL
jgi:hypothetical protein